VGHSGEPDKPGPGHSWNLALDAPLNELVGAIGPLVDQLAQVGSGLRAAQDMAKWSGSAAAAFRVTAGQRAAQISSVMRQVQQAADTAKAAAEMLF
jgi:ABC-type transporter Mla subunit MlaD